MPNKEHFFNSETPRSTNMERGQDVLNSNITTRFQASTVPGIRAVVGAIILPLQVVNDDNSIGAIPPGITGAMGKIELGVGLFKVFAGQAFDKNGEQLQVETDAVYIESNPLLTDVQIPPFPTPKSTGNTSIPFAKGPLSQDVSTFVFLKYLQVTDTNTLAATVPGFNFEYPKLDDGYEVLRVSNAVDAATAAAEGAIFLGYVKRFPSGHPDQGGPYDGVVHDRYPEGSLSPQFIRTSFGVNITDHLGDTDAHHAQAHLHSAADGSSVIDDGGSAVIGRASVTTFSYSLLTVGLGVQTFVVPAGLEYPNGATAIATSRSSPTVNMQGTVTAYVGTSLIVEVDAIAGTGTYSDWDIRIAGDSVKIAGQDISDNLSYATSCGVVTDLDLITSGNGYGTGVLGSELTPKKQNLYELMPNNIVSGAGGPVNAGAGASPDSIVLRQLRTGSRILVNGKEIKALQGPTTGGLFFFTFTASDTGLYYIVVKEDGTLDKVATSGFTANDARPRNAMVVGGVDVTAGKILGSTLGFNDLRVFGSIGNKDLQNYIVTQPKLDPDLWSLILAAGAGAVRWIVQGPAQATGNSPVVKMLTDRVSRITDVYIYSASVPTGTAGTGLEIDIRKNNNAAAGSIFTTLPKITAGRSANTPEGGLLMHVTTTAAALPDVGQINASANSFAVSDRVGLYITAIGSTVPGGDELLLMIKFA